MINLIDKMPKINVKSVDVEYTSGLFPSNFLRHYSLFLATNYLYCPYKFSPILLSKILCVIDKMPKINVKSVDVEYTSDIEDSMKKSLIEGGLLTGGTLQEG